MTEDNINGHIVKMYDNPEDMPVKRWAKWNKYLLISGDLGSTIDDLSSAVQRIGMLVQEDAETAITLLNNMIQSMHMIHNESMPKLYAVASIIHSIDGVEYNDLTDEGLKKVVDMIQEWRMVTVNEIEHRTKKKIDETLGEYYPALYRTGNNRAEEYCDILIDRALAELDTLINDADNDKKVRGLGVKIAAFYKPKSFMGPESADVLYEKRFNENCRILAHRINADPDHLTVMQYQAGWEYLQEISKKKPGKGRSVGADDLK